MKKEKYDYFDQFINLSENIVKSANILKNFMKNFDEKIVVNEINEVHKLENDSDRIIHEMRKVLIKDFLPPIDREDIALIGNRLDDIEDGIDEILINIKILDVENVKPDVLEQIEILEKCTMAVRETFVDLKNLKKIHLIIPKVIEINNLEEQGDRVYERLMAALYKNEKDPINLIKWTNIYKCLEDTIDACEEVGNCLEDVVVKNS